MQEHQTKKDKVYGEIKDAIISGGMEPGAKLIISSLAKKFHVSDIPVREALLVLVQEGYVKATPYVGFTVSAMSEEDVRKIFELRIVLESLAARLAVKHITNSSLQALTGMWEQSKTFLDTADFTGYWKFDREFHQTIYRFSDNDRLTHIIRELITCSKRYPQYYVDREQLQYSIYEHKEMIGALLARNEQHVEDLFKAHITVGCNTVLARIREHNKRFDVLHMAKEQCRKEQNNEAP